MKPNPNCAEHVKFAAKGVLTRLALMFNAEPRKRWTGKQVTEVLLRVVTLIEHGTEGVKFIGVTPKARRLPDGKDIEA